MNYLSVLNKIKEFSTNHPLVNEYDEGDVYEKLNSGEKHYPCVVFTPASLTIDEGVMNISGTLFYIDRETDNQDNKLMVQSAGITALTQISNKVLEELDSNIISRRYTPFEQKFSDLCAGVFCEISFSVPNEIVCYDSQFQYEEPQPIPPIVEQAVITYSSDHGTTPAQKTVDIPYSLTAEDLPTLSETGWVFNGWNKNVGDVISEDTTITASWSQQMCSVTYSSEHGTTPSSKTVAYGYSLTAEDLPTLSETGWVFNGWNKNVGDVISENTIITASWTEIVVDYLTFTSSGNSGVSMNNYGGNTPNIEYKLNNGSWTTWDYSNISLNNGDVLKMRGNNVYGFSYSDAVYSKFSMTGSLVASGSIMSLIDKNNVELDTIPSNYCFYTLFYNCPITTAPALPATNLKPYCYLGMFMYCSSLTTAPTLPATTLEVGCYYVMFERCPITTAPALPATNLANNCYSGMFMYCSNLTTAPALPATNLANSCYQYMFCYCRSLTTAPTLPATNLVKYCYQQMFIECSNLSNVKCLATSGINQNYSTSKWLNGVSATGTFVKASGVYWTTGEDGIPSGWTVQEE